MAKKAEPEVLQSTLTGRLDEAPASASVELPEVGDLRVVPVDVLRFLASSITAVVSGDSHRHRSELAASALAEIDRLIG